MRNDEPDQKISMKGTDGNIDGRKIKIYRIYRCVHYTGSAHDTTVVFSSVGTVKFVGFLE